MLLYIQANVCLAGILLNGTETSIWKALILNHFLPEMIFIWFPKIKKKKQTSYGYLQSMAQQELNSATG